VVVRQAVNPTRPSTPAPSSAASALNIRLLDRSTSILTPLRASAEIISAFPAK
jgi:hypothetical protein